VDVVNNMKIELQLSPKFDADVTTWYNTFGGFVWKK
jgi:hypothetical protein